MKELLVSFSGGETSAYMCHRLLERFTGKMSFVFANTSKEREETLEFANRIDKEYNLGLIWLEATFDSEKGIGYRVTNFENAKRNGEVFEEMIKCYGLPNQKYPHCTRELKGQPIHRWAKDNLSKDYWTAIGIRSDEIDRIANNRKGLRYYYPLVEDDYITKQHVNKFWSEHKYRLNLKGYQGNCDGCWKKSLRKLMTINKEDPKVLEWWQEMEEKYKDYVPPHRNRADHEGELSFYRNNLTANDIVKMSLSYFVPAEDDSLNCDIQETLFGYDLDNSGGCSESCEPF